MKRKVKDCRVPPMIAHPRGAPAPGGVFWPTKYDGGQLGAVLDRDNTASDVWADTAYRSTANSGAARPPRSETAIPAQEAAGQEDAGAYRARQRHPRQRALSVVPTPCDKKVTGQAAFNRLSRQAISASGEASLPLAAAGSEQ